MKIINDITNAVADMPNPNNMSENEQINFVTSPVHTKIQQIHNPSENVQLAAVKSNPWAIQYIKNPTEAVQQFAVTKNAYVFQHIKNPCEAAQVCVAQTKPIVLLDMDGKIAPKALKIALTDIDMLNNKGDYEYLVRKAFKDNQILANKWLSYRKNMTGGD